jgi:transcriptional regulator with XRE-family HTH domain
MASPTEPSIAFENLKELRKEVHLTQEQLADLADIKLSMVADIEIGRRRASAETAARLKEVLRKAKEEFREKTVKEIFVSTRTEKGLSQEEVARRAKINPAVYSKWEAGIASLDDAVIYRIHDAINEIADEKEKHLGLPRKLSLASLMSGRARDYVNEVWRKEQEKEAERVVSVVGDSLLIEGIKAVEEQAEKVPALEAEIVALKAQIAELEKKIHAPRKKQTRKGRSK